MADKEMVRVREKLTNNIETHSKADWDKMESEHNRFEVLGTEEEEQEKAIKAAIADSNKYDKEIAKDDKDGTHPANVAARTGTPPKVDQESATTGLTTDAVDAKGKKGA